MSDDRIAVITKCMPARDEDNDNWCPFISYYDRGEKYIGCRWSHGYYCPLIELPEGEPAYTPEGKKRDDCPLAKHHRPYCFGRFPRMINPACNDCPVQTECVEKIQHDREFDHKVSDHSLHVCENCLKMDTCKEFQMGEHTCDKWEECYTSCDERDPCKRGDCIYTFDNPEDCSARGCNHKTRSKYANKWEDED